jgi:uncharacterized NAD(P)/FAD-binding protein YdhS
VHIIDPNPPGSGTHYPDQANHLLMNTIAGQVSMFRAGDSAAGRPVSGLGLAEWAGVDDDVYLPRSALGRYLTYSYRRLLRAASDRILVREHAAWATRLRLSRDQSWAIHLSDGSTVTADFVFLATGHGTNHPTQEDERLAQFVADNARTNQRLRYLRNCYPLWQLDTIDPASRVAVRGMGLSAIDVIASLTVGRGGRFVPRPDGGLAYRPCGFEPKIFVYSRSCRIFWPRAVNQKAPSDTYQASFLTADAIRALRAANGQLDFDEHLLPLLLADMRAAAAAAGPVPDLAEIDSVLHPPGDPVRNRTLDGQQAAIIDFLAMDEVRAAEGNTRNPIKAATDALRDMRDNVRATVEHGGLTPTSHERFCRVYSPLMNAVAAGPPLSRSREWRALFDSGILRLASGPAPTVRTDAESAAFTIDSDYQCSPTQCDVIVGASVDRFTPERDTSSLVRSLLTAGLARGFRNDWFSPGGFDIDTAGRLVGAEGTVTPNICALGHITEGPHYFTNMLPAPGVDSRVTADAAAAVDAMSDHLLQVRSFRDGSLATQGVMR